MASLVMHLQHVAYLHSIKLFVNSASIKSSFHGAQRFSGGISA